VVDAEPAKPRSASGGFLPLFDTGIPARRWVGSREAKETAEDAGHAFSEHDS